MPSNIKQLFAGHALTEVTLEFPGKEHHGNHPNTQIGRVGRTTVIWWNVAESHVASSMFEWAKRPATIKSNGKRRERTVRTLEKCPLCHFQNDADSRQCAWQLEIKNSTNSRRIFTCENAWAVLTSHCTANPMRERDNIRLRFSPAFIYKTKQHKMLSLWCITSSALDTHVRNNSLVMWRRLPARRPRNERVIESAMREIVHSPHFL